ncbi:hypothetical protein Tco_1053699 [Tanacetum coccineum]|uniref:Uncharacterized protein n=1 Tax=Tanacetum coccineum TaxID=301880 RepID=A0ABQ5GWT9_9ASTR
MFSQDGGLEFLEFNLSRSSTEDEWLVLASQTLSSVRIFWRYVPKLGGEWIIVDNPDHLLHHGKRRPSSRSRKSLSPNGVGKEEEVAHNWIIIRNDRPFTQQCSFHRKFGARQGSLEVRATSVCFIFIPSMVLRVEANFGHQYKSIRKANLETLLLRFHRMVELFAREATTGCNNCDPKTGVVDGKDLQEVDGCWYFVSKKVHLVLLSPRYWRFSTEEVGIGGAGAGAGARSLVLLVLRECSDKYP